MTERERIRTEGEMKEQIVVYEKTTVTTLLFPSPCLSASFLSRRKRTLREREGEGEGRQHRLAPDERKRERARA